MKEGGYHLTVELVAAIAWFGLRNEMLLGRTVPAVLVVVLQDGVIEVGHDAGNQIVVESSEVAENPELVVPLLQELHGEFVGAQSFVPQRTGIDEGFGGELSAAYVILGEEVSHENDS
jgi:hypothetical protein